MTVRKHDPLESIWWPIERLGEALDRIARQAGLLVRPITETPRLPADMTHAGIDALSDWMRHAGEQLGVEALAVDTSVSDLAALLRGAGPAIVSYRSAGEPGFFVLVGRRAGKPLCLAPDLRHRTAPAAILADALCAGFDRQLGSDLDRVLAAAEVPDARRPDIHRAMLRARVADERIGGIWTVRLPASAPFARQLRHAGIFTRVGQILGLFVLLYAGETLAWRLIGSAALDGRLDFGWLEAWVLLVLALIPWRMLAGWLEAGFAIDTARILKSRLLAGAMAMAPDQVKRDGIGHLISRVMDSQALESLVLNGGMAVLVAVLELGFAGWILAQGAAPRLHLAMLVGWTVLALGLAWRYHRRLTLWSRQRLDMTHGLIEAMVGHRTRLAQRSAARQAAQDDDTLAAYLDTAGRMDKAGLFVFSGLPSGWVAAGLAALAPGIADGAMPAPVAMAVSLGGLLVAQRAFASIAAGLAGLSRGWFAWQEVAALFSAGGTAALAPRWQPLGRAIPGLPLVDAQGLGFRYTKDGAPIVNDVDLTIDRGERILLEGPSGGGKSTLAALLTGLRTPDSGLLLLDGLDRPTLGDNWHQRATSAPQFHENHILSGTLAFNLLMGRQWPAPAADLREAEDVCRELGLGDLLARMPGGLHQRVGETGWQLSHGERSRIFLARALLQRASLTVMDESFGALDPETMAQCVSATLRRTETLVVIAHP